MGNSGLTKYPMLEGILAIQKAPIQSMYSRRLSLGPCSHSRLEECFAAGLRGRGISGTNLYPGIVDAIMWLNRMASD
jgi:hypothetical protein